MDSKDTFADNDGKLFSGYRWLLGLRTLRPRSCVLMPISSSQIARLSKSFSKTARTKHFYSIMSITMQFNNSLQVALFNLLVRPALVQSPSPLL